MKKLIFAVDDEKSILEVYQYALSSAGYEVSCFLNGDELITALSEKTPDIVLLDIMLDGYGGYELLKYIRSKKETKSTPVIMISAKGGEIDKVKGLNLGADDYLVKPFGIMELTARINARLRSREEIIDLLEYKDLIINTTKHSVYVKDNKIVTTLKEYNLLKMFIEKAGIVLDRDKILDEVWGENYGETRTLDLHIAQLRKLIENSEAKISTVRGVGYILE